MSKLLFHLPTPTIPIFTRNTAASSSKWISTNESFPVRRIYCVGRNYREHTLEMGGNPDRDAPFFFMKPADAIVNCSPLLPPSHCENVTKVPYPTVTSSLHHEGELIIAIGKDGRDIPSSRAVDYIYGYSLGCDLTRRDLQSVAKEKGRPWDASKGFDDSCPTSPIVPQEDLIIDGCKNSINDMMLTLKVNGVTKQQSNIGSMIYSISEVIEHLSRLFWLRRGDLIMTGTPAGVGELW